MASNGFTLLEFILALAIATISGYAFQTLLAINARTAEQINAETDFLNMLSGLESVLGDSDVCGPTKVPFYSGSAVAHFNPGTVANEYQSESDAAKIALNPGGASLLSYVSADSRKAHLKINANSGASAENPAGLIIKRDPAETATTGQILVNVILNATSAANPQVPRLTNANAPLRLYLTIDAAKTIQSCRAIAQATAHVPSPPVCSGNQRLHWNGVQWSCDAGSVASNPLPCTYQYMGNLFTSTPLCRLFY